MKKIVLQMAMVLGMLFATSSAYAVCDGCVVGAVNAASSALTGAIGTASTNISTSIVTAINNLSANLSNVGVKVSDTVAQTGKAQRQANIDLQTSRDKERISRETELPVDPCATSGSNYASVAQGAASKVASSYARGSGARSVSSAVLNKALNDAIPSIQATKRQTQAIHAERYCDAIELRLGYDGCKSSQMPNGDANIESVMAGAGLPGKMPDLTFTKDQEEAARAFVRNATDPSPPEHISKAEAATEQGKLYIGMQKAYQANMSAAERPALDAIAARLPFDGSKKLIEQINMAEEAKKYWLATASKVALSTGTMSLAELQEFEAGRRYRNPYWVVSMAATADPVKLQREQVMMQAFANDVAYQQLRSTETLNIRMGLVLAALTRTEMRPQVDAQLQRAHSTNAR
ncbi:conjugal transfer protein TraW [Herbaspirillum seropedicae]|uniref:conjugal transfer protein TraW n=1 Tax=Herbaspirillum seropedicae TaxID=964 RepID=UPI002866D28D|nr:conjugal transfer protein TraW [Herbaspirillum seropedicae]MDR6397997.1 hypothetical protein [Herbaspirillum seropedicae]